MVCSMYFIVCLFWSFIYHGLGTRESQNPEISMGTDKNALKKAPSLLLKDQERDDSEGQKHFGDCNTCSIPGEYHK